MIRINLLPVREITAEFGRRQQLVLAGLSLGATLVLLVAVYFFQSYRLTSLRTEAQGLKKEVEALNVRLKEVANLRESVKGLEGKVKVIDDLSKRKVGPVKVMESLVAASPSRLWLTEFKESGGNLNVSGMAVDNQTIADFLKALATFAYFDNVDLVETTQVDQEGIPLKKFSIKSQLFYQPPLKSSAPKEAKKN